MDPDSGRSVGNFHREGGQKGGGTGCTVTQQALMPGFKSLVDLVSSAFVRRNAFSTPAIAGKEVHMPGVRNSRQREMQAGGEDTKDTGGFSHCSKQGMQTDDEMQSSLHF